MDLRSRNAERRGQVGLTKPLSRLELFEARDDAAPHGVLGSGDGPGLLLVIEMPNSLAQSRSPSPNAASRGRRTGPVTPYHQNLALSTRRTSRPGITTESLLSAVALRIVSSARLWPTSISAIPGLALNGFQRTWASTEV